MGRDTRLHFGWALLGAILLLALHRPAVHAVDVRSEATFRALPTLDYEQLESWVQQTSALLLPARRQALRAVFEAEQAHVLANPIVDVSWGTLPIGPTTPRDLERPYASVPSYGVGVAYTFPLGKRGARKLRAEHWARGQAAQVDLQARELTLALAAALGDLATATLRREGFEQLARGGERSLELAKARLGASFGTPLEVDRLSVEVQRARQLITGVNAEIEEALASCSMLLGVRCESFADGQAARAYLTRWSEREIEPARTLHDRPDLRAIDAYVAASSADAALARAEAIPDPTLRFGYLHDRFVVSGNQRNSLNLSLSLPLPVFDRGQVHQRAAEAERASLIAERDRTVQTALLRVPVLERRLALQRERCVTLAEQLLPRSRTVLADLEGAVASRLLPLGDVLQARRTVNELLIEEAESCGEAYHASLELIREGGVRSRE